MVGRLCILVLVVAALGQAEKYNYDGYTVHQAVPSSYEHLLKFLSEAKHLNLDFWHLPHGVNDTLDVMVGPELLQDLKGIFRKLEMKSKQVVHNVESLFEKERRSIHHINKRATPSISSYTVNFHPYTDIINFLHTVSNSNARSHNVHVDVFSIGKSTESRDMAMVKVYTGRSGSKPAILIDGGIHAREWIAPAVVMNYIYQFAFNPNNDGDITTLLNDFEWYFLPLVNPDGYHHSRVSERSWRKTMSVNSRSLCKGVDANRNFGYHWNPNSGGSTNPCEDIYAGEHSFSIPESTNLGAFMRQYASNIKAYLTYHSFGQYFLYPYGYSSSAVAPDKDDLDSIARIAVRAMSKFYFVGASGRDLYPAAGGSDDYAKGQCGIKYSYTIELPPRDSVGGYSGFIIDPSQIPDISADSLKGLKAFAFELARRQTS